MDLMTHVRVILSNWWRILLASLVVAAAVFLFEARKPDVYRARTVLNVQTGTVVPGQNQSDNDSFWAKTYARYGGTQYVVSRGVKASELDISTETALDRVSVDAGEATGFITVSATGPDRKSAEALARGVGLALLRFVGDQQSNALQRDLQALNEQMILLQAQLSTLPEGPARSAVQRSFDALVNASAERRIKPTQQIFVLAGARSPSSPVSPQPFRSALLAFAVALVVIGELTVLANAVGDRFNRGDDTGDVGRLTGLPVLARIPNGSDDEVVEAFRSLRTNLVLLDGAGHPRTIAVVSANPGAGKTFTAVHLARAASDLDEKVVLVDADLRRPAVHESTGVDREPGLREVLQGADVAASLRRVEGSSFLRVLPSGGTVDDPSAVLGSRAFRHVLDALRAVRLVVVDTPPAALFSDATAIASQCDAAVFVIDVQKSRRREVRSTVEALNQAGVNMVGVVINRSAKAPRAAYYYR